MPNRPRRKEGQVSIVWLIAGIGLILLSLFLLWPPSPQPVAATRTPEPQRSEEETFSEIPRAGLSDSKAALDNGKAVFIDVRDAGVYAESHIPGALSIPLAEIEERLAELEPSQWIITYCT